MAQVISREMCPTCQDSHQDNLAIYDNGDKYCFACGHLEKKTANITPFRAISTGNMTLLQGKFTDLTARAIKKEICEWFDYEVGLYTGKLASIAVKDEPVHIANYIKNGEKVAQKLRASDKRMIILGKSAEMDFYGQWKYSPNDKVFITIVEGEIDCLSVAQACGKNFPVVSVPLGAKSLKKTILNNLDYLQGFKYVLLALDDDRDGRAAMDECINLFEIGKVRVARWGQLKDANAYLTSGRESEIRNVLFNAETMKPKFLVGVSDIMDRVIKRPERGLDFPWPSMTDITYGFRTKEIYILVGAEGIGKTEIVKEVLYNFVKRQMKIGIFSFEQDPSETVKRLVGTALKRKLHLPGSEWNEKEVEKEAMKFNDYLYLCDQAGTLSEVDLINSIRYWAKAQSIKLIVIDNIKGLCRGATNENSHIKQLMLQFQTLARELDISFLLVSHVSKDKYTYQAYVSTSPKNIELAAEQTAEDVQKLLRKPGMEWENGRMPSKENVEGTSAICALADFVFAIARNTMAEDLIEQNTVRVKCLKARLDGSKIGHEFKLLYNNSGILEEIGHPNNSITDGIIT